MRGRVGILVVAVALAACSSPVSEDPGPVSSPAGEVGDEAAMRDAPEASGPPTRAGPTLLDFAAPAVDGGQVVGAEFAGQALAVWFWAPW